MNVVTRSIELPEVLAHAMRDRQVGHAVITKALPDDIGPSPRAAANALWHLDEATRQLTVRSTLPLDWSILGSAQSIDTSPTYSAGDRLHLDLSLDCQFTPPADVPPELRQVVKSGGRCYRSRRVTVPEERRTSWLIGKLAARGFEVDAASLTMSSVLSADLGRRGGAIPYVDISCDGTVTDADAFTKAVAEGVGKGKNFGLGLVRVASAIH
ncbi:hypothetical protein KEM60_02043 [Austwickia sp. TVS 96-490-7B]|uniref:type I-E CRISPR-associated protein Cas6/Cse3/CasE n=1 Tax=Austwickia sp. TVS 96-490-7B TaxID=2830843 RepID=UPI001C57914F|nr:type I-E CRISPR-associated protein Cas6/Cse3/CasE [Austwickia sp. TVS 96-490-7B]MBW3085832.1 hypothetical protein [Austwickia sp. TVS 96-490-7B]